MKFPSLPVGVTRFAGKTTLVVQKNAPAILTTVGISGMVVAGVVGAKAHVKAQDIYSRIRDTKEAISGTIAARDEKFEIVLNDGSVETYTDQQARVDKVVMYSSAGIDLLKVYGPALVIASASIVSILVGQRILQKRNLALVAAYKTLEEGYSKYRDRIREVLGEDKEAGIYAETVVEQIMERQREADEARNDDRRGCKYGSTYARVFDETNPNWQGSKDESHVFMLAVQNHLNDKLRSRGHLFLNEVYQALGLSHTPEGAITGWVYDGNGDGYVDLHIQELWGLPGYENKRTSYLIDPNVDGVMYDLI